MHHGAIAVESRMGRGSRFVVTLPRDPREIGAVPVPVPADPGGPPGPTAVADGPATGLEASVSKVDDSSPSATSPVNPDQAG